MYIFLIVPTHVFEKLQQCGTMCPDTQKEWRGYTVSPNRICAAQLAGFPDEDGTVLALQVPTEEISLVDLTDEEERALTVVHKRQDIKAALFPELCLSFVKGQDAFLNTGFFVSKPNFSDLRQTGCEVLRRLLSKHPDGDARYQSLCILAAGDFLVWKAGFVKSNPSDCAELCMMIDGLLFSNDDAIAVELGIHPFGCRELAAYTVCNSVCRKYFALQDLATEKIDKKAATGAIKFLERRSSCAPITVILRNTERSSGEDQESSYRIIASGKFIEGNHNARNRFFKLLRAACYVLRTREQELQEKNSGAEEKAIPKMLLMIEAKGKLLVTITWKKDGFHIRNQRTSIAPD